MNAPAKTAAKPLSPHLQVYRLPLAAWLSITHRATGVGLTLGLAVLTWWVVAGAYGPAAYDQVTDFMSTRFGLFILFGFSVALFFHLCNGIRHLIWDTGIGFEKTQTAASNLFVLGATTVLTAATWLYAVYW